MNLEKELQSEFDRYIDLVGTSDLQDTYALGVHDVLKAHFLIAEFFAESGNKLVAVGPRDVHLLHSALSRQHAGYGQERKWKTPIQVAATLFYGLIKDHPFHDANKRTALLSLLYSLLYHLSLMRLVPTCDQKELEKLAIKVASNTLTRSKKYGRENSDHTAMAIARFLKNNTRQLDKKFYHVTYHKLKSILNRFGYDLQNPRGNTIDIVRVEEPLNIWKALRLRRNTLYVKVAQIGFPGWTKEVGKSAIKTVRQKTDLTAERGIDSATFFKDQDPIDCLISRYQEPLISLASR